MYFVVRTSVISDSNTPQLLSFLDRDKPRPYISLFRICKANTRFLIDCHLGILARPEKLIDLGLDGIFAG